MLNKHQHLQWKLVAWFVWLLFWLSQHLFLFFHICWQVGRDHLTQFLSSTHVLQLCRATSHIIFQMSNFHLNFFSSTVSTSCCSFSFRFWDLIPSHEWKKIAQASRLNIISSTISCLRSLWCWLCSTPAFAISSTGSFSNAPFKSWCVLQLILYLSHRISFNSYCILHFIFSNNY